MTCRRASNRLTGKPHPTCSFLAKTLGIGVIIALTALRCSIAVEAPAGLEASFLFKADGSNSATDTAVLPGVCLYLPAGEAPTPFLPPGRLQTTWRGAISSELKGEYSF